MSFPPLVGKLRDAGHGRSRGKGAPRNRCAGVHSDGKGKAGPCIARTGLNFAERISRRERQIHPKLFENNYFNYTNMLVYDYSSSSFADIWFWNNVTLIYSIFR